MGISKYKIKKWINMLLGKSVHHVNQGLGRCYSKNEIKGYYNDLTEKVTRFGLEGTDVPKTQIDTGEEIFFSIGIFQYGLASYDLYLLNRDSTMLDRAIACADWAVNNQGENGAWITFSHEMPEHPYSSMAQGEAISLLLRVYYETSNEVYLECAKKSKEFMLLPIEKGGTTKYVGEDIFLLEYTHEAPVLNGWIFSYWGLRDYCIVIQDKEVDKVLETTLLTMISKLPDYDNGYWSKYDDGDKIASPFYHSLHIAQLKVMYELTELDDFKVYANKWERYRNKKVNRTVAFWKKAYQKIFE